MDNIQRESMKRAGEYLSKKENERDRKRNNYRKRKVTNRIKGVSISSFRNTRSVIY